MLGSASAAPATDADQCSEGSQQDQGSLQPCTATCRAEFAARLRELGEHKADELAELLGIDASQHGHSRRRLREAEAEQPAPARSMPAVSPEERVASDFSLRRQDLAALQVRLGTYSNKTAHIPPAALVTTHAVSADPRSKPRFGKRVPYVVVHGEPGARLFDMVVPPRALVESRGELRLGGGQGLGSMQGEWGTQAAGSAQSTRPFDFPAAHGAPRCSLP
ncbi:hypothetical protein ABPG77_002678 [Micractinium sp. CCAP 211/92]